MTNIFLSHSKEDFNIINVFRNAFNGTEVYPVFMEYEKFPNPPWTAIKNTIENSSTLFVLLSNNLKISDYTQNWVSYEVGVADEANKEIWVFEDINNQVIFPLPKVHHYMLYCQNQQDSLEYLRTIIRSYALNPKGAIGLGLISLLAFSNPIVAIIGAVLGSKINIPNKPVGIGVTCPYTNCGIKFQYHNLLTTIRCPSCRQHFQINIQK